MRSEKNILIAFLLNLVFSVFEFVGGMLTGSVAIASDALHDLADAASIGLSFFLEKKSKRKPDPVYTYGYSRYSVVGSVITTLVLLAGSLLVIYHAIGRLIAPAPIHYDGMILFAVIGVAVNLGAAFVTREAGSANQKAVNLHMLEDVLGWLVVLIGAVVMRFTDIRLLDPLLSIGVAVFILIHAIGNLKEALDLFLEKVPKGVDTEQIRNHIASIPEVLDVHHIHIWSMDGRQNYATVHIVTQADTAAVKEAVRAELHQHGIGHATIELESPHEHCHAVTCDAVPIAHRHHHHH